MTNNVLELRTAEALSFKNMIDDLQKIVNNVVFEIINENELKYIQLLTTDRNRTLFIDARIESTQFSTFDCVGNKFLLPIELTTFYKMIQCIDENDTLTLSIVDTDTANLIIKIENDSCKYVSITKLHLLNIEQKSIIIKQRGWGALMAIEYKEFSKICRDLKLISDEFTICITNESVKFISVGDVANRTIELLNDDGGIIKIKYNDDVNQSISSTHDIKNLMLFTKCDSTIQLHLKKNFPLCVKYKISNICGRVLLYLSPIDETHVRSEFNNDENN